MREYHKIQTAFKRTERGQIIEGLWSMDEFGYLRDLEWVWTEKVDGTNVRVMFGEDGTPRFGGKTDNAQMPVFLFDKLGELFPEPSPDFAGLTFYGEGFGAKIQKGGGNYGPVDFVLFDVRSEDVWLERENVEDISSQFLIQVAPVVGRGTLQEAIDFVRAGFQSRWGNFTAEGIVARPAVELRTRRGERVITKIKVRDFK